MSVIIISTDSPSFVCSSPANYIDAESIDTSFVYESGYSPTCDDNDPITVIGGGQDGDDGTDGADGRSIVSIIRTTGDGSAGTTDTYTITYNLAPLTSFFNVFNGADGSSGTKGDDGTGGGAGTQGDTGADGADGNTITANDTDPTILNPGNNGDLHVRTTTYDLYEKAAGTWSIIGNVQGAVGNDGADGTDGIDGDQWSYSTDIPSSTTVNAFDEYHLYTVNNTVYYKAEGATTWASITNLNGDVFKTSSSTSVNLSTLLVGDSQAIEVDTALAYTAGQFVVVANDSSNTFTGTVDTYSGTTLTLDITYVTGSGTLTSWDANLAGVVASDSVPQWYTITATAGTGDIASRVFTAPTGWTVDSSDNISVPDLPISSSLDLTIKHNTGLYAVDAVVLVNEGTYNTKATGTRAYGTMYEDQNHTAAQLSSFCTEQNALIIHIKLQ